MVIFTDCLTAMYNLMAILETPQNFAGHKHDSLLGQTEQALKIAAYQGRCTTIRKVRAHAGISGNEMADTTTKGSSGAEVVH